MSSSMSSCQVLIRSLLLVTLALIFSEATAALTSDGSSRPTELHSHPLGPSTGAAGSFQEANPKYHLYDPKSILAFSQCKPQVYGNRKHSIDKLFIHQLLKERKSVPPEQADVFVVPALLSQVTQGKCGNKNRVMRQLRTFLNESSWFQRHGGADHMMIGDHFLVRGNMARSVLSRGVVGHFESRSRTPSIFFSTGDSTDAALALSGWSARSPPHGAQLPEPSIEGLTGPWTIPFWQRKYDVSFVGQVDRRFAYKHRRQLGCSWVTGGKEKYSDRMLVHLRGSFGPCVAGGERHSMERLNEGRSVLADSRFFVALTGDTPTTDRLNNCFDTLTIPVVLSSKLNAIMGAVAFTDVVPWRDIFVVIDQAAWNRNPVQAVVDTVDALSTRETAARVQLMRKHADDLSFASPATRMHTRLINAAWQAMQKRALSLDDAVNSTDDTVRA